MLLINDENQDAHKKNKNI